MLPWEPDLLGAWASMSVCVWQRTGQRPGQMVGRTGKPPGLKGWNIHEPEGALAYAPVWYWELHIGPQRAAVPSESGIMSWERRTSQCVMRLLLLALPTSWKRKAYSTANQPCSIELWRVLSCFYYCGAVKMESSLSPVTCPEDCRCCWFALLMKEEKMWEPCHLCRDSAQDCSPEWTVSGTKAL